MYLIKDLKTKKMKARKDISKKFLKIITTILLVLMVGCDFSEHLEESPPHIMTAENLFQDRSGFESALNGLYSRVRAEFNNADTGSFMTFNSGTDTNVTNHSATYNSARLMEAWGDVMSASNQMVERPWNWLYDIVNIANNIIAYAEADESPLSVNDQNIISADARAVRAWAYRHLTYLWGDVPLTLEPSTGANIKTDWQRTPVNGVRQQMIEDLLFAQEYIPTEGTLTGRMTKGAVQHWLAETYLAVGDDENALFWADEVINNTAYELITERYGAHTGEPGVPFMDMFKAENTQRESGNTEALWVFQYQFGAIGGDNHTPHLRRKIMSRYDAINVDGVSVFQVTHQRGGRSNARMSMTKWALELYEPEDDRGSQHAIRRYFILQDAAGNAPHPADNLPPSWAYGDTLWLNWEGDITLQTRSRVNWPFSRKYDWAQVENPRVESNFHPIVYLRLADTYLVKAEAQLGLNDPAGAAETINVIRDRANASVITASDVDIDFILDERARELVNEGHRRYHLLRVDKWLERTQLYNNNGGQFIEERHRLFPIPQSVIDANETEFPQNPGYN